MPPKPGNQNAVKAGTRMPGSRYPAGSGRLPRQHGALRRQVREIVATVHGEVTLVHEALIDTVVRFQKHADLCARWLWKSFDSLTPAERLKFSAESAEAAAKRDKALVALNLDRDTKQSVFELIRAAQASGVPAVVPPMSQVNQQTDSPENAANKLPGALEAKEPE